MEIKKFADPEGNVWKYIFHLDGAIAEAVLYKYGSFKERTVMCVSVQSGCPVGCTFCGTGKKFIRNLTKREIIDQVLHLASEVQKMEEVDLMTDECKKLQIMFMSMGEPMLNLDEVVQAISFLNTYFNPNAQLLISTIGIKNYDNLKILMDMSIKIDKIGLQFSIHEAFDEDRDLLIPFKNKLNLREIRDYGILWSCKTNRQVYLNYCVHEHNSSKEHLNKLKDLFPSKYFAFTFSVICESEQGKCSSDNSLLLMDCQESMLSSDYNVRIFDPAGKDTIGGGCGQLWYVQDYFNSL